MKAKKKAVRVRNYLRWSKPTKSERKLLNMYAQAQQASLPCALPALALT